MSQLPVVVLPQCKVSKPESRVTRSHTSRGFTKKKRRHRRRPTYPPPRSRDSRHIRSLANKYNDDHETEATEPTFSLRNVYDALPDPNSAVIPRDIRQSRPLNPKAKRRHTHHRTRSHSYSIALEPCLGSDSPVLRRSVYLKYNSSKKEEGHQ
mmetsp:Transcript_21521/g.24023  ORF Transcript_21521/g.24023 Transcript_21521/m.24023 type:complete len:153 (+) Transcript_21521:76-534(+)